MRITYAPGEWTVIVRSGTLIVLPADAGQSIISAMWEALAEAHNLEAALRAVTRAFDGDVTGMPPFAIASLQSRLHVVVRGRITLRSRSGEAITEVSGAHVTTWNEQVLHDQDSLDVGFGEATSGKPPLPLEAGVVRAAGLVISLTGSGQSVDGAGSAGTVASPDAEPAQPAVAPDAEPAQPAVAPDAEPAQLSSGAGGDQTMNPTDLDAFEEDDEDQVGAEEPVETGELSHAHEPAPAGDSSGPRDSAGQGLIESVPWMKPGPGSSATGAGSAEPAPASGAQAFDHEIDHDGQTVMRSELNAPPTPGSSPEGTDTAASRGPSTAPVVLARMCPSGHANPPTNANCSTCGSPITSDPLQTRRPSLGSMRMSNGEVVELDRSVIVGRQPSMSRVQGNVMPRMVQVRSDESDISRSHVEVQLEGWHVMLRDLNSTNGTFLVREGQPPRRLAQGEQAMLLDGDVAELGDDVRLRFEGLK